MVAPAPIRKADQMQQANKYEEVIKNVIEYLLSDIRMSDDEVVKFTIVDYFCLTDYKPSEVLAYIRRFKPNMDSFERRVISKFLGGYQDSGDQMTDERLKKESLAYIINGAEIKVTNEMWLEIRNMFDEYNIPDQRLVMNVAARRMIYVQPILPIIDIAKKENKAIQFIKK